MPDEHGPWRESQSQVQAPDALTMQLQSTRSLTSACCDQLPKPLLRHAPFEECWPGSEAAAAVPAAAVRQPLSQPATAATVLAVPEAAVTLEACCCNARSSRPSSVAELTRHGGSDHTWRATCRPLGLLSWLPGAPGVGEAAHSTTPRGWALHGPHTYVQRTAGRLHANKP